MSPQELSALPSLDEDDFKVFGALIQHFCFIDLNLRRALGSLSRLRRRCRRASTKPISELARFGSSRRVLVKIVKGMDATVEDIPTALTFLEGISKARGTGILWDTSQASVSLTRTFTSSSAKATKTRGKPASVSELVMCIWAVVGAIRVLGNDEHSWAGSVMACEQIRRMGTAPLSRGGCLSGFRAAFRARPTP